jgi:hypothetical protein
LNGGAGRSSALAKPANPQNCITMRLRSRRATHFHWSASGAGGSRYPDARARVVVNRRMACAMNDLQWRTRRARSQRRACARISSCTDGVPWHYNSGLHVVDQRRRLFSEQLEALLDQ